MLQVVEGLEAAHAAGVLHRDIKPSNCFLGRDGTIKIGDFGLSISAGVLEGPTRRGAFEGTPEFAAPEQILGEPTDVRADIYSVGATFYFLLTGHAPFQAPDLDRLLETIRTAPIRLPSELESGIHPKLSALLRRCLSKAPSDRPASYAEIKQALAPFASAGTTPAPVGLRVAAAAFDVVVMAPVVAIMLGRLVGAQVIHDRTGAVVLIIGALALYWGLLEGVFGAGYGKRRCGLVVVTTDGRPAGVVRALARSVVFVMPLVLATIVDAWLGPALLPPLLAAVRLAVLGVGIGTLILPMRSHHGFAGLHDTLTGTHVIRRAPGAAPSPVRAASPPAPESADGRKGPYDLASVVGATDIGQIRLGWDPRLKRSVWIHELPAGAPAVAILARNVSRAGRLHWLNGARADAEAWDAYESLEGQPLLTLHRPQTWHSVSVWLCDLARELAAGVANGLVEPLALDRVWITPDGHGKLLSFRAPGLPVDLGFEPLCPECSTAVLACGRPARAGHTGSAPAGVRVRLPPGTGAREV